MVVRHPNIRPVKAHSIGAAPDGECAKDHAIASPQFRHIVTVKVRYPDIGAVERYPGRARANLKCAKCSAIPGPQFADCRRGIVRYPDVGAVKSDEVCPAPYGKGSQD